MNRRSPNLAIAALLILLLLTVEAWAQSYQETDSSNNFRFEESGFITGMGTGGRSEGKYEPNLLIWHLASDLRRYVEPLREYRGKLSFILEPQINPAFRPHTNLELGLGIGLQYTYPLTDRLSPYVVGMVGPHFITVQTENQASGFIFADTIGVGIYLNLDRKSAINLGYRFRHLSNAGLKDSNGGINTHFGIIGYSMFF